MDPFAGSYVVEAMTDEVEARAVALMDRVAEFGSAVEAIEAGFQKREIETSAYQVAQEIDCGERVVVGVNRFALAEEEPYEPLRVDPAIEADAGGPAAGAARRARRGRRSTRRWPRCARRPRGPTTCCPPMREALRARATVGEVCDALRGVWGLYRPARSALATRLRARIVRAHCGPPARRYCRISAHHGCGGAGSAIRDTLRRRPGAY